MGHEPGHGGGQGRDWEGFRRFAGASCQGLWASGLPELTGAPSVAHVVVCPTHPYVLELAAVRLRTGVNRDAVHPHPGGDGPYPPDGTFLRARGPETRDCARAIRLSKRKVEVLYR